MLLLCHHLGMLCFKVVFKVLSRSIRACMISCVSCSHMVSCTSFVPSTCLRTSHHPMCDVCNAVYSYGVILWELFTGHEPWQDKTPMQVRRHKTPQRVLRMGQGKEVEACADVSSFDLLTR